MNVYNNPSLTIEVDTDEYTERRNQSPIQSYNQIVRAETHCNKIVPVPSINSDYSEMSFGSEYGKLAARDIYNKLKEAERERFIEEGGCIKRVKSYANGSEIVNIVLENGVDVERFICVCNKLFVSLRISSKSKQRKIVTPLFPIEKLDSAEEIEKIMNRYFEVCDTRAYQKKFLLSLANFLRSKLNCKTPEIVKNVGWSKSKDGAYRFEVTNGIAEYVDIPQISNHNLPRYNDEIATDELGNQIAEFFAKNSNHVKEISYMICFGICANFSSFLNRDLARTPVLNIVGNVKSCIAMANSLLSLLECGGCAWIYNIQDYEKEGIKKLFELPLDDTLVLDVSNLKYRKDIFKILSMGTTISNVKIQTPIVFLHDSIPNDPVDDVFLLVDQINIGKEEGKAIKRLKMFLLNRLVENQAQITKLLELQERGYVSPMNTFHQFLYEYGEEIFPRDLNHLLIRMFDEAVKFSGKCEKTSPEICIFARVLHSEICANKVRLINHSECKDTMTIESSVLKKDNNLYLSKALFVNICSDCRFDATIITKLKRNLYRSFLLKTYGDKSDFMVDLWLPSMGEKFSMYCLSQEILENMEL